MPAPIRHPPDSRLRSRPRIASRPRTRQQRPTVVESCGDREERQRQQRRLRRDRRIGHQELREEPTIEQQRLRIGERDQKPAQGDGADRARLRANAREADGSRDPLPHAEKEQAGDADPAHPCEPPGEHAQRPARSARGATRLPKRFRPRSEDRSVCRGIKFKVMVWLYPADRPYTATVGPPLRGPTGHAGEPQRRRSAAVGLRHHCQRRREQLA